jgi:2-phospho-L-lactate/phosphoenolpyruvate guanylyltransferase
MNATAVLPVKRYAIAKRRLAAGLPAELRERLSEAMLADVLSALDRARKLDRVIAVTSEPRAARAAREHGAEVIDDSGHDGHSRAAALGVARALQGGARAAALVPGDCPLLDPEDLDTALDGLGERHVAIVPDRHGRGTNALLLTPPDAIQPAFGEGSRERHERLARAAEREVTIERLPSLGLDVDTPDDLAALRNVLTAHPDRAPRTAATLRAGIPA